MTNTHPTGEEQVLLSAAEEERIDRAADEILERFREAFEELAK